MLKNQLNAAAAKLGFVASTEEAWDSLTYAPPEVIFIAPAHDTVPSPSGNAIYVLLERLCKKLPYSCAILARWPITGKPGINGVSRRILYFRGSMRPTLLERILPYRVKKWVWGHELLHQIGYAKKAGKMARQLGAMVVIVEDTPAFCPAVRASVGSGIRILLHQHCEKPSVLSTSTWHRVVKSLDGIVFVAKESLALTERLHGRLRVPSSVIYSGVDLNHYCPQRWKDEAIKLRNKLGIGANARVLLFVGRLVPGKGVAEAAEAFNLAGIRDTHMIIVGKLDGSRFEDYLNRMRGAASESFGRIHIVGTIPQETLPAYYQTSDVVILPSITKEGLPKIIFESLAMGCPVIASNRGGIWELLDRSKNGWLLHDPEQPKAIAETLKTVFKTPDDISQKTEEILKTHRSKMCEKKMIGSFGELLALLVSE